MATAYNGVFLSEVFTHGAGTSNDVLTNGDWIELFNSTDSPVDMTGAILSDSGNSHKYVIGTNSPAGTATIAADSYQAYRVDSSDNTGAANFSLGDRTRRGSTPRTPRLGPAPRPTSSIGVTPRSTVGRGTSQVR